METWSDEYITLKASEAAALVHKTVALPKEHLAGHEVSLQDPHVNSVASKETLEHETDPDFLCEVCHHHHDDRSPHLD